MTTVIGEFDAVKFFGIVPFDVVFEAAASGDVVDEVIALRVLNISGMKFQRTKGLVE